MLYSTLKKMLPILLLLFIKTEAVADSAILDLSGSNVTITIGQYGGNQSLDLSVTGNNHSIQVVQRNVGSHTANVDLTNDGGAYEFNLLQDDTIDRSVNVTGVCITSSGCGLAISQK